MSQDIESAAAQLHSQSHPNVSEPRLPSLAVGNPSAPVADLIERIEAQWKEDADFIILSGNIVRELCTAARRQERLDVLLRQISGKAWDYLPVKLRAGIAEELAEGKK